jgi:hypothetical protein
VSIAGLLLLLAASSPQDAEQRLAACLAESYPRVDEARRREMASRLSRGIQAAATSYGHDAGQMLGFVEQKLQSGAMRIQLAEGQAQGLAKAATPWISDAASRLTPPPAFAERIRESTFSAVEAYVSEVVSRPAATAEEKQAVSAQYARVADEIRDVARTRISGPYRDGIVNRVVDELLRVQTGPTLGDPVAGMLTRPLPAADLERILRQIRELAASEQPVEASSLEDRSFTEKGTWPDTLSPALELAQRLAGGLYLLGRAAYPRATVAFEEQDRALHEAIAWIDEAWAPMEKDLARRHAEFRPPERSLPNAASRHAPGPARAAGAEPSAHAPVRTPVEAPGAEAPRRWIPVALVIGALLAIWLWRRFRTS